MMALRTCIATTPADWRQLREDLVTTLAARGVLHCAGVASALLDTGRAVTERDRSATAVQDASGEPGAP